MRTNLGFKDCAYWENQLEEFFELIFKKNFLVLYTGKYSSYQEGQSWIGVSFGSKFLISYDNFSDSFEYYRWVVDFAKGLQGSSQASRQKCSYFVFDPCDLVCLEQYEFLLFDRQVFHDADTKPRVVSLAVPVERPESGFEINYQQCNKLVEFLCPEQKEQRLCLHLKNFSVTDSSKKFQWDEVNWVLSDFQLKLHSIKARSFGFCVEETKIMEAGICCQIELGNLNFRPEDFLNLRPGAEVLFELPESLPVILKIDSKNFASGNLVISEAGISLKLEEYVGEIGKLIDQCSGFDTTYRPVKNTLESEEQTTISTETRTLDRTSNLGV